MKCKCWDARYTCRHTRLNNSIANPCKGYDRNCNSIFKPAKKRIVRVKAWAWKSKGVYGWCATELNPPSGKIPRIPCDILINQKYLKHD